MPHPTLPVRNSRFDVASIAGELRGEEGYAREGHAARTLVREGDLRIVLVAIRAGSTIQEHRADHTVSIHALSGTVRVHVPDGADELSAGQLSVLQRNLPHRVEALADSTFLLTLGFSG